LGLKRFLTVAAFIPVSSTVRAWRDPRDDKFLELALDGEADWIVSGDQDLLVLHPFRGIPVLTPQAFLTAHDPGAAVDGPA
jgi:predicted nucleic acid-binding protein